MYAMMREVGAAELEGEVNVGKGVKAYLYRQSDGSRTLLYWAEKPGGQIAPNLLPGAYRHVNWCGAEGDSFADSFADINSRAQNMV